MWSINGIIQNLTSEQKNQVLIDSCTQLGFDIPRFCYHENLKIAGNCRMCLIEDSKAPKPVICCAGNASADLNIFTNTVQVKKSRESVMEFLLINHPLDCPICDQGGECDLQDLALVYGSDHGRFYDYKRNVEDKNCGPVVKTVMNRCILCTRCVRFATDIAGFDAFGVTGRGGKMEIGSYVEKIIDSDLSGNLIDVCPVGALTSKPYSFVSRPWELKKVSVFSFIDDQPQLIRADIKENEVVRFLPAKNAKGNNLWITNRTRFSYEGLSRGRIVEPLICGTETNWIILLNTIKSVLYNTKQINTRSMGYLIKFDINDISDTDYLDFVSIKTFLNGLGNYSFSALQLNEQQNFTFLPRVSLSSNTVDTFVADTNINFELPITGITLYQLLLTSMGKNFVVTWRAGLTSLLSPFSINLLSSLKGVITFLNGKSWINALLFNRGARLKNTIYIFYSLALQPIIAIFKNNYKNVMLHLITTTALRTVLDINISNSVSERVSQSASILGWFLGSRQESIVLKNSAVSILHATHWIDNLRNEIIIPNKNYMENNSIFYDTDYTVLKSFRTISASPNCKTTKNVLKVFAKLFSIQDSASCELQPLYTKGIMNIEFLNIAQSYVNQFISTNKLYKVKLISKTSYYQMFSVLTSSPTLSSIQRNSINSNIY